MRRLLQRIYPIVLLLLWCSACFDRNKNENNNFLNLIFQPNPVPSVTPPGSSSCPTATLVALKVFDGAPARIRVGETTQLDATPYAGTVKMPDECSLSKPITWTGDGTTCVRVGAIGSYTPEVRGLAPGTCVYRASVDNVTSPSISIEVVP